MAAAGIEESAGAWFGEVHEEHADVPWFVDFDDLCAAAFASVEIVIAVNSFVTH